MIKMAKPRFCLTMHIQATGSVEKGIKSLSKTIAAYKKENPWWNAEEVIRQKYERAKANR